MDNDLLVYIERLELMAFFSGYPVIYFIVRVIAGEQRKQPNIFLNKLVMLLPGAYAFTGLLFLGYLLKSTFIAYPEVRFQITFIKTWALLSVLFWIPAFRKKPVLCLLHSLVFFFFLLKDLFMMMISNINPEVIENDMKVYTDSLILNTSVLIIMTVLHFLLIRIRATRCVH